MKYLLIALFMIFQTNIRSNQITLQNPFYENELLSENTIAKNIDLDLDPLDYDSWKIQEDNYI